MTAASLKTRLLFFVYFGLAALITWAFVVAAPMYISKDQMMLSTAIAGSKWGIQIVLAFIFLREKKWIFLKNIGSVCFTGSCILLPYIFFSSAGNIDHIQFFTGSLLLSVLTMIYMYYKAATSIGISLNWWFLWLGCLAIAIALQLTVVFHVFKM